MCEEISVACTPMQQNMRAYQTITNNHGPHINAELLLASRMYNTVRIALFPLVLVVNIYETCLVCKER
jgi:hypothetical protein